MDSRERLCIALEAVALAAACSLFYLLADIQSGCVAFSNVAGRTAASQLPGSAMTRQSLLARVAHRPASRRTESCESRQFDVELSFTP